MTPPTTVSDDAAARFATIPAAMSFEELLALVRTAVGANVPLVEALRQLQAMGYEGLPAPAASAETWTPEQEQALAELIKLKGPASAGVGSPQAAPGARGPVGPQVPLVEHGPTSPAGLWDHVGAGVTSPYVVTEQRKGFWFNLNAELIIYGATEPGAKVSIAGRRVPLRHDGTFSCRFAFPDGRFEFPVIAVSAAGDDARLAELEFSRRTERTGEVGAAAQDPTLRELSPRGTS
jgi:hypothetical protein